MNSSLVLFCCVIGLLVSIVVGAGGTFTVNCVPLTIQRSDPIVNPGIASAHVHNIIGGNAFRRNMAGMFDARNATSTTCDKALDHSNYWVPAIYHQRTDGLLEMVKWTHAAVYYQKRACDYAPNVRTCNGDNFVQLAFPDGFRMLAGDPMRRTQNNSDFAQKAISFMCLGNPGNADVAGFPKKQCTTLRAQAYFPSCWDGLNVDTPDHRSHVAYPAFGDYNGGVCPQSHPKAIFSIFYEFFFDTGYTDFNRFVLANGDPTGLGYHGDFMMGWTDRVALQNAHANCINAANCPNLGFQAATSRTLITPAMYEEEVGLNGPISKLPGNNPFTWPK